VAGNKMSSGDEYAKTVTSSPNDSNTEKAAKSNRGWIYAVAIISIALVIIGILLLTYNAHKAFNPDNTITPTPECSDDTSGLPDISNQGNCVGGGLTKQYVSGSLNLIAGPTGQAWATVCQQYCGSNGTFVPATSTAPATCTSFDVNQPTQQSNFNACVAAASTDGCTGVARPIAISGGVPYYGQLGGVTCTVQPVSSS
jgi:hypothetical protein